MLTSLYDLLIVITSKLVVSSDSICEGTPWKSNSNLWSGINVLSYVLYVNHFINVTLSVLKNLTLEMCLCYSCAGGWTYRAVGLLTQTIKVALGNPADVSFGLPLKHCQDCVSNKMLVLNAMMSFIFRSCLAYVLHFRPVSIVLLQDICSTDLQQQSDVYE